MSPTSISGGYHFGYNPHGRFLNLIVNKFNICIKIYVFANNLL